MTSPNDSSSKVYFQCSIHIYSLACMRKQKVERDFSIVHNDILSIFADRGVRDRQCRVLLSPSVKNVVELFVPAGFSNRNKQFGNFQGISTRQYFF